MAYVGNTPSKVPLTSADITDSIITSAKITDGTIVNADIANSTINLTTKVTGSLPIANGGTGLTALGTASQVLRTNSGATALEFATLSSDFVLLASTDASASASVSFDGYFSSTYKNYKLICSNLIPSSSSGYPRIRLRRSNADVTTSNYNSGGGGQFQRTGVSSGFDYFGTNSGSYIFLQTETGTRDTTNLGFSTEITIFDPLSTTARKSLTAINSPYRDTSLTYYVDTIHSSGYLDDNNNALSGITFYMSTGNITSGNFKLYGIK